jgi:hypothetical protein
MRRKNNCEAGRSGAMRRKNNCEADRRKNNGAMRRKNNCEAGAKQVGSERCGPQITAKQVGERITERCEAAKQ